MTDNTIDTTAGIVAGMLGTIAFTAFFALIDNLGVVTTAIPALYGIKGPSLLIGGLIHLIHGAILGVLFVSIINGLGYQDHLESVAKLGGWGIGYGVLTGIVLAALLMPVWLSTVGFTNAPPFPNFSPMGLLGHVIYGVVLGLTYPAFTGQ